MSQGPAKPSSSSLNSDGPLCTRSSDYQPAPPERQSRLSQLIVKTELALMAAAALVLGMKLFHSHQQDRSPVKIASAQSALPLLSALPNGAGAAEGGFVDGADPGKGQVLYMQTCTTCHGQALTGMPHQGVNLRDSKFVASTNDQKLVAFIKVGRKPADAKNTTGLLMPPRGGNPSLDDDALANIVAFLRQAQKESGLAQDTSQAPSTKPFASVQQ